MTNQPRNDTFPLSSRVLLGVAIQIVPACKSYALSIACPKLLQRCRRAGRLEYRAMTFYKVMYPPFTEDTLGKNKGNFSDDNWYANAFKQLTLAKICSILKLLTRRDERRVFLYMQNFNILIYINNLQVFWLFLK
ncbi:MAG: hypothetical protein ABH810_04000 [bacterium]